MTEKTYKATLRIPTAEPYAYLEIAIEDAPEAILSVYSEFTRLVKVGEGLARNEWNDCLQRYVAGKGMDVECFERMNSAQKWWIHEWDKLQERKPKK